LAKVVIFCEYYMQTAKKLQFLTSLEVQQCILNEKAVHL
jgi:hypothetical protein